MDGHVAEQPIKTPGGVVIPLAVTEHLAERHAPRRQVIAGVGGVAGLQALNGARLAHGQFSRCKVALAERVDDAPGGHDDDGRQPNHGAPPQQRGPRLYPVRGAEVRQHLSGQNQSHKGQAEPVRLFRCQQQADQGP